MVFDTSLLDQSYGPSTLEVSERLQDTMAPLLASFQSDAESYDFRFDTTGVKVSHCPLQTQLLSIALHPVPFLDYQVSVPLSTRLRPFQWPLFTEINYVSAMPLAGIPTTKPRRRIYKMLS
jgi:hypothetical protein